MNDNGYGKYRGKVEDNWDPERRGRLLVSCAGLLGKERVWAMPCVPYAGKDADRVVGLFVLPPKGANVWVEWEGGGSGRLIWSGCFWGQNEAPGKNGQPDIKVLQTKVGSITFNDSPSSGAGIIIETTSGAKITLSDSVIKIENGKGATIEMTVKKVSINGNALEVE